MISASCTVCLKDFSRRAVNCYYDEEPKRLPKFGALVRISATRCRKIGGAESLEEIRAKTLCHNIALIKIRFITTCM